MTPTNSDVVPAVPCIHVHDTVRSRELRRLDWRFLLPRPPDGGFRHLVLLGGSDDIARNLLRLGVARKVSRQLPRGAGADVLVMLAQSPATITDAALCLEPGGVLFCEVDRSSLRRCTRTPGRVKREMLAAGLTPTGTFWVKPNLVNCGMYLPLELNHAIRWYFETLYQAQSRGRRILRSLVRFVTRFRGERLGQLAPYFAVTARKGPHLGCDLPDVLREALPCEQWPDLRPLFSLGGEGEWSRVVVLPFRPCDVTPTAVVKFPRIPVFNAETAHERAKLKAIRSRLDPAMRSTLPQPFAEHDWNGLRVTVESRVDGKSLASGYDGKRSSWPRAIQDLQMAAAWLSEFHRQTRRDDLVAERGQAHTMIRRKLQAYTANFDCEAAETQLLEAATAELHRRRDSAVTIVSQHNDFGPWNVYRFGDDIQVIDWEVVRDGLGGCDLIYFVMHWIRQVRRRRGDSHRSASLKELFVDLQPVDDLVRSARTVLLEYLDRSAIDRELLPVLLVYTLVEQALDRRDRETRLGLQASTGEPDNPYVHDVRVIAEHTLRLFAGVCGVAAPNLWWR